MRFIRHALCLAAACAVSGVAAQAAYAPPAPPSDTSLYGRHFQRSMTLMATSTARKRNTVRILFYGQSIIGQKWHTMVADDLKKRFPYTDFVIENRAIGGFSSQRLVRTMHYDVFDFYPDLMVFHVYGSHQDYEKIIKEVRSRTTAEVIMQSDHANKWPEPKCTGNFWVEQKAWEDKMNYFLLPKIAQTYNCGWQPQRWEWADYLRANNLQPPALLKDGVHLNEHGRWLMAELLKRFLVYLPDEPDTEWKDMVTTLTVGRDIHWRGNRLKLEFDGNRVVALAGPGSQAKVDVLVDGVRPGRIPACYTFTRPTGTPGVGWPAVKKITWENPPVVETWTVTCRNFNDVQDDFEFTITGSVTGPDGSGRSKERFVSNSGRVVIEPDDWVFAYDRKVSGRRARDGHTFTFGVKPLFTDTYQPDRVTDTTREHPTVLVSNLDNRRHTIELVAHGKRPSIQALRVYRPPYGR